MKYLSVSEFAAAHGISEQAVYKKIRAGKLPTVEREKNGKKTKFIPEEEPAAGAAAAPDAGAAAALAAALAALTEQLKTKDAQIMAQAEEIKELTKLLDQAQRLQAHTNRLLELSAHPEAAPAASDGAAGEPSEGGPVSGTQEARTPGSAQGAPRAHPGSPGEVPATGTTQPEAKRGFWSRLFG